MDFLPIGRNFVMASTGGGMHEIFKAAMAGDQLALEVIFAMIPNTLTPLARRRLRDGRLIQLAETIYSAIPGATPYQAATLIHAAGREAEAGRGLDHPAFGALDDVRDTVEAVIRSLLNFLPINRASGGKMPTVETIYSILR